MEGNDISDDHVSIVCQIGPVPQKSVDWHIQDEEVICIASKVCQCARIEVVPWGMKILQRIRGLAHLIPPQAWYRLPQLTSHSILWSHGSHRPTWMPSLWWTWCSVSPDQCWHIIGLCAHLRTNVQLWIGWRQVAPTRCFATTFQQHIFRVSRICGFLAYPMEGHIVRRSWVFFWWACSSMYTSTLASMFFFFHGSRLHCKIGRCNCRPWVHQAAMRGRSWGTQPVTTSRLSGMANVMSQDLVPSSCIVLDCCMFKSFPEGFPIESAVSPFGVSKSLPCCIPVVQLGHKPSLRSSSHISSCRADPVCVHDPFVGYTQCPWYVDVAHQTDRSALWIPLSADPPARVLVISVSPTISCSDACSSRNEMIPVLDFKCFSRLGSFSPVFISVSDFCGCSSVDETQTSCILVSVMEFLASMPSRTLMSMLIHSAAPAFGQSSVLCSPFKQFAHTPSLVMICWIELRVFPQGLCTWSWGVILLLFAVSSPDATNESFWPTLVSGAAAPNPLPSVASPTAVASVISTSVSLDWSSLVTMGNFNFGTNHSIRSGNLQMNKTFLLAPIFRFLKPDGYADALNTNNECSSPVRISQMLPHPNKSTTHPSYINATRRIPRHIPTQSPKNSSLGSPLPVMDFKSPGVSNNFM